ncbi:hypothetical protein FB451DRAFT_1464350 [Mycena latifolia]|nr:hypothetical protein FB451DRAFT_1464350 [Mycena latifolia]
MADYFDDFEIPDDELMAGPHLGPASGAQLPAQAGPDPKRLETPIQESSTGNSAQRTVDSHGMDLSVPLTIFLRKSFDINFTSQNPGNWPSTSSPSNMPMQGVNKPRKREATSDNSFTNEKAKKPKRPCFKCGQDGCKGSSRKNLCRNACADCKQLECEGRNGSHPTVPCSGGTWRVG